MLLCLQAGGCRNISVAGADEDRIPAPTCLQWGSVGFGGSYCDEILRGAVTNQSRLAFQEAGLTNTGAKKHLEVSVGMQPQNSKE